MSAGSPPPCPPTPPRLQLTVPPPGTGRSAGPSGGCRGPTPSSPFSAGFGCPIRLGGVCAWGQAEIPPPSTVFPPRLKKHPHPSPSHTFGQPVWDFCLVLAADPDLALVGQESFLHGVKHQRVEEAVLGGAGRKRCGGAQLSESPAPPPKSAPCLGRVWGSPPSPGTGQECRSH